MLETHVPDQNALSPSKMFRVRDVAYLVLSHLTDIDPVFAYRKGGHRHVFLQQGIYEIGNIHILSWRHQASYTLSQNVDPTVDKQVEGGALPAA